MSENEKNYAQELRRRAEEIVNNTNEVTPDTEYSTDVAQVIHDLKVYQIELEIQNEDLRRTQQELISSRNKFSDLFNRAPVGYLILDGDALIIDVNDTFCDMTGWNIAKIKGQRFFTFLHEKDQNYFISRYRALYNEPIGKSFEVKLKRHAKNSLTVRLQATVYEDPQNDVDQQQSSAYTTPINRRTLPKEEDNKRAKEKSQRYLLINVIDVSEQKEAQQELLIKSEAIESSVNSIAIADLRGIINYVNKAFLEAWDYQSKEEVVGRHVTEFWHTQEDPREVVEALRENHKWQGEMLARRKMGQNFYCYVSSHLVTNDEGEPVCMMASFLDISQRKEAELKEKAYKEELERQSREVKVLYDRLNEEVEKAKKIHERVLPESLPQIPGVEQTAFIQPAETMGGDFYDIKVKGDKLLLYLSDVSGHGLDGAMMSVFVKNTMDDYFQLQPESEITPGAILRYLAEKYHRESYPDDYLIALFIAVIDLQTWEMSYVGAGFHIPPLAVINKQQLKLDTKGMPVTSAFSLDFINFEEKQLQLEPGITILFTTDGLAEQDGENGMYKDRMEDLFYSNACYPPQIISSLINKDFWEFNGYRYQPHDDITYIIFHLLPGESDEACASSALKFSRELGGDFSEIEKLIGELEEVMSEIPQCDYLIMGLQELVTNAMEHGNKFAPQTQVKIDITLRENCFFARIEDEGEGFDWRQKLNCEMDLEGKCERGRGITMTELAADHVLYNEKGNVVYMLKKL